MWIAGTSCDIPTTGIHMKVDEPDLRPSLCPAMGFLERRSVSLAMLVMALCFSGTSWELKHRHLFAFRGHCSPTYSHCYPKRDSSVGPFLIKIDADQ